MSFRYFCGLVATLTGLIFSQESIGYLIITSSDFVTAASIISNLHSNEVDFNQRLQTTIMTTDSIAAQYPELALPEATRQYVLNRMEDYPNLQYLLIIGDETVVTPYYDIYGIPSDDFYSSLQTTFPIARLSTGRIPVSEIGTSIQITDKIRTYVLDPPSGRWKNSVLLLADDAHKADGGDILVEISHVSNSNNIYEQIKDGLDVKCIYGTEYPLFFGGGIPTLPEMTSDILDAINSGVAWINYIGHGNETTLADELILDMERDITFMSPPAGQLPVWVVGSCDLGHYDNSDSFTEALISKPDGAIAVITTTRLIMSQSVGAYLDRLYSKVEDYSLGLSNFRMGDLVRESKSGSSDYVFQLFGDPAIPIILPTRANVVNTYPDTVEVLTPNSLNLNVDYQNELSYLSVYGPTRFIHQVYNGWVNLNYQLPGERIYAGDFVEYAQFYVPLDFPVCESCPVEVKVFCDHAGQSFQTSMETISGIPVVPPQSITDFSPPIISLYYNDETIMEQQMIDPPFRFDMVIQDSSGVNLMGLPGHQILVQIDDLPAENFTDRFTYMPEIQGQGIVPVEISMALSGYHTLKVEAWDNANNRGILEIPLCFINCELPVINESILWTSVTSLLTPHQLLGYSGNECYGATDGGLLKLVLSTGEFEKILPGEILKYSTLVSVSKDNNGNLWLGAKHPGTLQIYHPQYGLIRVIDNLGLEEISDITFYGNSAFAIGKTGISQSIIEFRLDEDDLPYFQAVYPLPGSPPDISHISFSGDTLFVATSSGEYYGSISSGMLTFSVSWHPILEGWQPKFYFPGEVPVMVTASSILTLTSGSWTIVYPNLPGTVLNAGWTSDTHFCVLSSTRFYEFDSDFTLIAGYPLSPPPGTTFTSWSTDAEHHIFGVNKQGFRVIDRETLLSSEYVPNTGFTNEMNAITYASDGSFSAVSRKGMLHFSDGVATNFIASSHTSGYILNQLDDLNFSGISMSYSPGSNLPWSIVESMEYQFLFSNSGVTPDLPGTRGGVIEIDPVALEMTVYDTTNGILDGLNGIYNPGWTNRYLTINQIKKDPQGNLWVVNPYSEVYNHIAAIKLADGTGWAHVTGPDNTSYLPQEVAFDGYGRAWFGIQYDVPMNNNISEYSNGGLRVLDFGQTPGDETDDVWLQVLNDDILPSNSVWSLDIDYYNHVWVVTSGGIQGYEMTNTDNGILISELLGWPAYTQIPFYIGDHIRVDNNNNKWVTTRHHGAFGFLSDNSLLESGAGFNTQNSGLLSDLVYDVSVNHQDGLVAFATMNGVSIYNTQELPIHPFEPGGDVNGDHQTDVNDVVNVVFYILGLTEFGGLNHFEADMNLDGLVDIMDVVAIVDQILGNDVLNLQYPTQLRVISDEKETRLSADGELIAYHLFFNRDLIQTIDVRSPNWMGFQNNNEFIAVNLSPGSDSGNRYDLRIFVGSGFHIVSGRGCTRDGSCIEVSLPGQFSLSAPYPNPFNSTVTIAYTIPESGKVSIVIFDVLGRRVTEIYPGMQYTGKQSVVWDGEQFASGVYFVRLEYQGNSQIRKILLLK